MKPNISPNFRHRDVIAQAVKHGCSWHPYDNFSPQSSTSGTCYEDRFALKLVLNEIKSLRGARIDLPGNISHIPREIERPI